MKTDAKSKTGVKLDAKERLKTSAIATKGNAQIQAGGQNGEQPTSGIVDMDEVRSIIEDWPAMSKSAAHQTIGAYGPPNEAVPSRLVWYNNGPWKRTIAYRDEILHNFPDPHTDVVENFIDYKVPPEKFSELAKFDGSVIVERTKGEVSARCDMEAANILALNMMHEIATGKKSAAEAREMYSEQTAAYVMNRSAPYAEELQFELPTNGTTDPDEITIGDEIANQLKEKIEDVLE